MRIADLTHSQHLTNQLLDNKQALSAHQARIASGQKYARRSEAPVETALAAELVRNQERADQWLANLADVQQWERATQRGIERGLETLQRLRELTVEARNGTISGGERGHLANEVDSLLGELVDAANTQLGDRYIFGGGRTGQAAVSTTVAGGSISAVTYQGSEVRREAALGDVTSFGYGAVAGGPAGVFVNTTSGADLFQTAIELRDTLAAGQAPAESTFDALDDSIASLSGQLAQTGIRQQKLESTRIRVADLQLGDRQRHSALADTDMSEAVVELSRLQVTFQASLQMAASLQKLSMVNYI